jgi:hypothetical protein
MDGPKNNNGAGSVELIGTHANGEGFVFVVILSSTESNASIEVSIGERGDGRGEARLRMTLSEKVRCKSFKTCVTWNAHFWKGLLSSI